MRSAAITGIASHVPDRVVSNDDLARDFPGWTAPKILEKTGISERRVAAEGETAADLAVQAANRLLDRMAVPRSSIDFLLFCTQTPDHYLPATACLLQDRLGLGRHAGALDYNGGCSGFVYGLGLAKGLIEAGLASRVLLLTSDTYSKVMHPGDRSVCTLFGDGAAATLVEAEEADEPALGPFVFGTDGGGGKHLIVKAGGFRQPHSPETAALSTDSSGNVRSADNLYMNGPEILTFALRRVPEAVSELLRLSKATVDAFDLVVMHQANAFILSKLRDKLKIPTERFVVDMSHVGNTVSSSIPLALERHLGRGEGRRRRAMVVGFGVGYSWAAASISI